MKKLCCLFIAASFSLSLMAQFNFGFEEFKPRTDTLSDWNVASGRSYYGPLFNIDKEIKHSGRQSLSIERKLTDTSTQLTSINIVIPADFDGKQLKFSCWIKTEDVKARAQVWFNIVDAAGGNLQLVNFPGLPGITGTTGWKEYSTMIPLPEDANKIIFGFLLFGTGKVWGDDFNLQVDNQPFNKRVQVKKSVYKAIFDTKEFAKGSRIDLTTVTEFQKENLSLLAKVWGFLKYYHPFIAKGNLNWDYELFRFLPSYLTIKNKTDRNDLLLQWVNKLGKPDPCGNCSDELLRKAIYQPDLDWLRDKKTLGDSLVTALVYIKNNRHQGKSFYMQMAEGTGNPSVLHEAGYGQFAYPDAGYRLLALFRYWNMIQYWFPYKHLIGEDWQNILPEFIPKMIGAGSKTEYLVITRQLIGRIHDTHANIIGYNKTLDSLKGMLYPLIKIKFIDDRAMVTQTHETASPDADIRVGDMIQSIDGKKITDIIKEKLPDLPASNYPTQLRDLALILLRGNDSLSSIVIERDGKKKETKLRRWDPKKVNIPYYTYDFPYQKDSSFFFIRPGIGYINLGKIKKSQLDSVFKSLEGSKGLIIDNRQYPTDFPIYTIAGKLLPEKKEFTKVPQANLDYPGAFVIDATLSAGWKNKDYYKGKLVILVDENTQSSAEFHSMAFRQTPGATVIGSTTAGADGDVSYFYLPGGIYTRFSGISILNPDGTETQRVGIIPDIELKSTIEGIKNGRDEWVEKAVELINVDAQNKKKGF
ncbi:MAG: S41 family peptidase [Bacteroidota bacterium]